MWILQDDTKPEDPRYLLCSTAIGPAHTPDKSKAERFETKKDAFASPSYAHWSSFFEPVEVAK